MENNKVILNVTSDNKIKTIKGDSFYIFGLKPNEIVEKDLSSILPLDVTLIKNTIYNTVQFSKTKDEDMAITIWIEPNNTSYRLTIQNCTTPISPSNINKSSDREEVINQLRSLTDELQTSKTELLHALEKEKELSELKSRFVSMASHEFRTPLTSILSSASLIQRYTETEQQDKRDKHISRIKASVSTLTTILNDFLSLSKLEEGDLTIEFQPVNLIMLCMSTIDELSSICKKNQSIFFEVVGEKQDVFGDAAYIKNILLNMLSNAIKYSAKNIDFKLFYYSDYYELQVVDQGIGIPFNDQKHLFTKFFRASNTTHIQGTGLGLNILRSYVHSLGGEINFESEVGLGSTFSVLLPYHNI